MPDRILLPLIVACALFMENLDSTVLSTALPTIAADFGESPIRLKLALTSYLLALAVFLPASGWLADRFGVRTIFRLAIIIFTLSSVYCGLSDSVGEIVVGRVAQGIGGSMMVPVGRLVILRSVKKSELVGAMAWLTIPALIGPVMGPPVGGFLTTYADWRWVFWINVPIGVLGLVLATIFFPDIRSETRERFDIRGFLLVGLGLATFVTGSTSLGLGVLSPAAVAGLLAVGAALLAAYYWYYRRNARAILDLGLFRFATFRAAVLGGSVFRLAAGATPFLLPLMLQVAFGMTPFESGLITFVSAAGAIAMKFAAGPILKRFGFRTVLLTNIGITATFTAIPATFTPVTPIAVMVAILLAAGFFRSLQFTAVNAIAYDEVEPSRMSKATAMSSVFQQLSLSVGISIGAIALELSVGGDEISTGDFLLPYLVVAVLCASSFFFFARLPPHAGHEISGHRARDVAPRDAADVAVQQGLER
ncbi:MAG: DHA2 family efflux MFS transporter permease subunit [Bauldia sp.]|nr:DHA2 family efflux MFS transporter permease subunit [Bauldia sp.]